MKATKNLNGAARVAVQAKLDAADKELRKARDLVQQRTEELGRVRETVRQHELENEVLSAKVSDLNRQIKWVGERCSKHLDTIQTLEARQVDHDEFVEKLGLELDIAEEQIQYHKGRVATVKWIAYGLCGAVVVLAWKLSQHIGWFGGAL